MNTFRTMRKLVRLMSQVSWDLYGDRADRGFRIRTVAIGAAGEGECPLIFAANRIIDGSRLGNHSYVTAGTWLGFEPGLPTSIANASDWPRDRSLLRTCWRLRRILLRAARLKEKE